ncbi:small T antigen [Alphapolyomavirus septipanos]|uniref:Small T antigen n=1 Tax=Alphapolyomavirus septipanos TaxID=1891739 RepID=K7QJJ6_9POLY|nr:small T antigen [Alphapolyomavirus septipanos]AFU25595.1 small T antigen [Alphapolyomavirus septipanos]
MDQTLSQDERKEYMELLKLPPAAWGNIPMMKKAYKTVVKTLHPDKGGDSAKMQRLNELHQKMQSTLLDIRSNCGTSSSQVAFWFWDENFRTLGEFLGETFEKKIIFFYPDCVRYNRKFCNCISCLLKKQHSSTKKQKKKPCMVWGECFCYYCYLNWFGFVDNYTTFSYWSLLMKNMDLALLRLWTEMGF